MTAPEINPLDLLDFWFAAGRDKWFEHDEAFDAEVRERYADAHQAARDGAYRDWLDTPEGAVAYVVLLDQFARNIHRDSAKAYEADDMARAAADMALEKGYDRDLPKASRQWLYIPFMHSEKLADQERCVALCEAADLEDNIDFAKAHRDIIARFGRFPHRNAVLGRESRADEIEFLEKGGFSG